MVKLAVKNENVFGGLKTRVVYVRIRSRKVESDKNYTQDDFYLFF